MKKKWVESNALFIAAFISSLFLLFVLIEPLMIPFYYSKRGLESSAIRVNYVTNIPNSINQNSLDTSKNELLLEKSQIAANENSQKSDPSQIILPPPVLSPYSAPAGSSSSPNGFSFNTPQPSESVNSTPILGGRSGFRSKAPSSPGPKKGVDSASDQALETYRNQVGREAERRQAQTELAQVMTSLETHEEYRCVSKSKSEGTDKTKMQPTSNSLIVQCNPASPKAAFLEWVIGRLYPENTCITIYASKLNGFKKLDCDQPTMN